MKTYTIQAFASQDSVDDGCIAEEYTLTLKDAKVCARNYLTGDSESAPMGYVRIVLDTHTYGRSPECVWDETL
jgi:hypothetical protein